MKRTTKKTQSNKIEMTQELLVALRQAYFCCREIGSRNQSDYEIESMKAAEQIRTAVRAAGADPESADAFSTRR